MRHKRVYAILISILILDSALAIARIGHLGSPFGDSSRKLTPPGPKHYFGGRFFVNKSSLATNSSTAKVGSTFPVDFIVTPEVNITGAELNMTVPTLTLATLTPAVTYFKGNIQAGTSVDLSAYIKAKVETEVDLLVQATGYAELPGSRYLTSEIYFLNVNTTGWYTVTHTPPPYDPYGKNATILPVVNVTSGAASGGFVITSQAAGRSSFQVTPLSPGPGIPISGTISYTANLGAPDCPSGAVPCPVRLARIEVWDEDSCVADHKLGTTYTTGTGSFSITVPDSFGPFNSCTVNNVHVSVFAQNDATARSVPSCPAGNCDWGYWEGLLYRGPAHSGVPLPLGSLVFGGDGQGFQLYDDLLRASQVMVGFGFTQTWEQAGVYNSGGMFTPVTNIGTIPDGVNFFPNPAFFAWGSSTVFHEYGHSLMERIYQLLNWPCSLGCVTASPHFLSSVTGPGFAISEGWAEFLSALIFGSNTVTSGPGSGNLESTNYNCGGCNGDIIEGSVAKVFWDLQFQGEDGTPPLLSFLIGANAGAGSEFHTNHRNDMLDVFTDIRNAGMAGLSPLCAVYTENGLSPPQCQGLAVFPSGFLGLGLIILLLGLATRMAGKRGIRIP